MSTCDTVTWIATQECLPAGEHYKYIYCSSGTDTVTFRASGISSEEHLKSWIQGFNGNVKWVNRRTAPKTKHICKADLTCHHNTVQHSKVKLASSKPYQYIKNTNCPAYLKVTLEKEGFYSPYTLQCKMNPQHNHSLTSAEALGKLPVTKETDGKLVQLFHHGHTAASALGQLKSQHASQSNFSALANRQNIPDRKYVERLFNNDLRTKNGDPALSGHRLINMVKEKLKDHKHITVASRMLANNLAAITIITDLMRRCHKTRESGNIVFFDSSGEMDGQSTRVFLMVTHSPVGSLPLGVFLTHSESSEAIVAGLEMIVELIGHEAYYGKGSNGPSYFMVDDSRAEQKAIRQVHPKSSILLCVFHVMEFVKRWLQDRKHNVDKAFVSTYLDQFKGLVYASESNYASRFELLKSEIQHPKFSDYVTDLDARKELWAIHLRDDTISGGNNTNNLVERQFRVMKETVLRRSIAFNCVSLAEKIAIVYNMWSITRLLDAAHGKLADVHLLYDQRLSMYNLATGTDAPTGWCTSLRTETTPTPTPTRNPTPTPTPTPTPAAAEPDEPDEPGDYNSALDDMVQIMRAADSDDKKLIQSFAKKYVTATPAKRANMVIQGTIAFTRKRKKIKAKRRGGKKTV